MSDILIKGMKMPVACFDCPCMQDLSNIDEEYYICAAIEHAPEITNKNNGRLPKCPLVEIPTPHGRLIDEEAIYNNVKSRCSNCHIRICAICGVTRILNDIRTAPTIIEAEVSE